MLRTPEMRSRRQYVGRRRYRTIKEFAHAMLRLVDYQDEDGRDIGYDYLYIQKAVLRKFPIVPQAGPHKGHRTKMTLKELREMARFLNQQPGGVRLPFRPRSKLKKN